MTKRVRYYYYWYFYTYAMGLAKRINQEEVKKKTVRTENYLTPLFLAAFLPAAAAASRLRLFGPSQTHTFLLWSGFCVCLYHCVRIRMYRYRPIPPCFIASRIVSELAAHTRKFKRKKKREKNIRLLCELLFSSQYFTS